MALFVPLLKFGRSCSSAISSVRWISDRKKYIYEFYKPGRSRPSGEEAHKNCSIPRLPISCTGSVYETKIKRKKEIQDPNLPLGGYWESTRESLKWTDWKMMRDVNRRLATAEYFPMRQNVTLVMRNRLLPEELRHEAHKDIYNMPVKCSEGSVNNRCVITSRSRGKLRSWRMSRIIWRHIADNNNMSGVMKSTWGP